MTPLPSPKPPEPLAAPAFEVDRNFAKKGAGAFVQCSICHGLNAISGGIAPDLRASPVVLSHEAFSEVVRGGARRDRGMPSYETLSDDQLQTLQHYLREQAELALAGSSGAIP